MLQLTVKCTRHKHAQVRTENTDEATKESIKRSYPTKEISYLSVTALHILRGVGLLYKTRQLAKLISPRLSLC